MPAQVSTDTPVALTSFTSAGNPEFKPASSVPEMARSAFDYMPATLAGHLAGIGVVCFLFWDLEPPSVLLPWLAAFVAMWLSRLWMTLRYHRASPQTDADWARWLRLANVGALCGGALWGITAWLFYRPEGGIQQIALIVIVYTFCVVVVPVLSTQPRVYLAFVAVCFLPMVARILYVGDTYSYQLAGLLAIIIGMTVLLARNYRQALQRVIDLKLQADGLAAQLRVEKAAADAARQEAEVANRAKTQFFTAASHDLRQPLHAMGLFAEALRQKSHDTEVAQLVNSINESVDALEGLFSELLDITRIDTGGVEVHPESFGIGDIYRKLRLHFEPTAFEKGLALRFRGAAHAAHADPLLVERILRNLVSNAIRYTNDGTVLVGCRRSGGLLRLQVWDSGPGIREAEQARIFEEFYQVPNTARVAPNQRKGLGLGLAIVKRLADLMHAPLALRSQVGHGTVFTLDLPLGKAVAAKPAVVPGKGPSGLTLHGRLIVVVEDEPAVLAGLEVLLKGWGAEVASFDSVAASTAWAASCAAQTTNAATQPVKPDLLIVDYRLENALTGVDAIVGLRQHFGAAVPAIVVTGSTMSGHEQDAQAHNFHVLIKPVLPNKLRAMIAFKLKVKPP